jgi:large subunit ribosomal protein L29
MKIEEVRQLSDNELHTRLNQAYEELFNLRLQRATRQLTNTARPGAVRRNIAQLKMVLHERTNQMQTAE